MKKGAGDEAPGILHNIQSCNHRKGFMESVNFALSLEGWLRCVTSGDRDKSHAQCIQSGVRSPVWLKRLKSG